MVNKEKKALVYCRVSTVSQEEKGTSLESQEAGCIEHATKLGYEVTNIIKEVYSGAYLYERPLLDAERGKIRNYEYDAIIVYNLDRLSRDNRHLIIMSEEFDRSETKLISVTEVIDNTPQGILMQSIKGYLAEVEREKIRERTLRGKRTKVQNGKLLAASDLYGYVTDRINNVRNINETESHIVKRIYQEYLAGKGINKIAIGLNDDEIPSPGSGKRNFKKVEKYTNLAKHGRTLWGRGTIRRILIEPAYSGESYSFRYKSDDGYEKGTRYHRIETLPKEEWIALPENTTPAIVSIGMFQAVQERLGSNKNADKTRNEQKPVLLRGLVYCGDCGSKMYPEIEKKTRIIFRCPSRNSINCGGKRINADKCDIAVWEQIANIIRNPNTIALELERRKAEGRSEQINLEGDIKLIRDNLTTIESAIKLIVSRAAAFDDQFVYQTFQEQIKLKKQERDRCSIALSDAERRLTAYNNDLQGWESFTEFSQRVAGNLDSFGFDEKRLAFEALNVKIIGNGKKIQLKHSFPIEKQDVSSDHADDRRSGETLCFIIKSQLL